MGYIQPNPGAINVFSTSNDPADSSNYYWGLRYTSAMTTDATYAYFHIPYGCKIRKAVISWLETAIVGTNEDISMYIRKNNTTDYLIKTIGTASGAVKLFSNYAMNIPVAEGDFFEIKVVTPAWVTNPQGVVQYGIIYYE